MLLNNLDPEVAEHPERLVVYGGSGRAARSHEALKGIVRALLELADDETLLVQSGKAVGIFRTHPAAPARADRERSARAPLGNARGVPPAGGARVDDVRSDDRRLVDLHRNAGDSPGHLSDVLCGRGEALRHVRSGRSDDPDGRPRRHGRRAAARRNNGGRSHPVRRGRPVADRPAPRHEIPRRGNRVARRGAGTCARRGRGSPRRYRSGCSGTPRWCFRSSPAGGCASTWSPTRRRLTIHLPDTSPASCRSRRQRASASSVPTSI